MVKEGPEIKSSYTVREQGDSTEYSDPAFVESLRHAKHVDVKWDGMDAGNAAHRWWPSGERNAVAEFENGEKIEVKKSVPAASREWTWSHVSLPEGIDQNPNLAFQFVRGECILRAERAYHDSSFPDMNVDVRYKQLAKKHGVDEYWIHAVANEEVERNA